MKKYLILTLLLSLILTGASCEKDTSVLGPPKQIALEWWTVFKEPNNLRGIIDAYRAQYPHVVINVRTFRADEIENEVIGALAEDRGPDIVTFGNTATRRWESKLVPMPASTTMKVAVQKGAVRKQIYTEERIVPSFSQRYLQQTFLDQALEDGKIGDGVYGLPLGMDNLALYYNKDILAASGIALPATNYAELQEHVLKMTKKDRLGNIIQSGIAMGTSSNVDRFSDILSLLMMQNGTEMTNDQGFATFDRLPAALSGRSSLPAADALTFYTDYANPSKQVYNWNAQLPSALEAFMQGRVGYFMGYSYHQPLIRTQAPKLNYGIAPMLQIEGNTKVNFANYQLEGVLQKSKNIDAAWNFLQFVVRPENVKQYLDAAQYPTATKTLIDQQVEDVNIGVFAEQLLTAKSWYHGKNPDIVPTIFAEMIRDMLSGTKEIQRILEDSRAKINQSIR